MLLVVFTLPLLIVYVPGIVGAADVTVAELAMTVPAAEARLTLKVLPLMPVIESGPVILVVFESDTVEELLVTLPTEEARTTLMVVPVTLAIEYGPVMPISEVESTTLPEESVMVGPAAELSVTENVLPLTLEIV